MIDKRDVKIINGYWKLSDHSNIKRNDFIIYVDALRASNTLLELFKSGAKSVKIFSFVKDICSFKANTESANFVFVGEQQGRDVRDLDFNNSPSQICRNKEVLKHKSVAMLTTNFAKAVICSKKCICEKLVGSLRNVGALTRYFKGKNFSDNKIYIVAVGRNEAEASEDMVTAEFLKASLCGDRILDTHYLENTYNRSGAGNNLKKLGFEEDIDFSLRIDDCDIIPRIYGDLIKE